MSTAPRLAGGGPLPADFRGLGARRWFAGLLAVVIGLPAVTAALVPGRASTPLATPVLLVLAVVVLGALLGGLRIGLPAAVAGAFVLNWFFTPPYGTLAVDSTGQLVVLAVYLGVTVAVSIVVDLAARRSAEATRARAEADALGALAGAALAEQQTLPGVLRRVAELFGMREVTLLESTASGWERVESVSVGTVAEAPDDVEFAIESESGVRLVVRGPELFAADQRVLTAFADVAATALEGRRLAQRAADAAASEAGDRMRTALLAAVGHDLRTPLSAVKAAVSSLRQRDVEWTAAEAAGLLETIEDGADRLQRLVENLLAASRLQAGVVTADVQPVGLDEIVARALLALPEPDRVHVDVPDDLPPMSADVGLAERILGNVIENALRFTPAGLMVTVRGTARPDAVICEVVDHGPGLPDAQWETIFRAFQRAGDRSPDGLGLGLTVASGFAEAMGATLTPGRTDGGGFTMRVAFPLAATAAGG
ncbi:MAG: two-component system, OmpR family, sensor histidine kinase KdpD [Frankiaceae bacterium]|nr:two-component system, OmpR family, sensor histidine kinase KdpD [Frankiaceae bacterium]